MKKILFKGYRFNSTVRNYTYARTGVDCLMECVVYGKSCGSVNYNKASDFDKNCEFLQDVSWEKPDLLLKNESYNHYILLNCPNTERVSTACIAFKRIFLNVTTVFFSTILGLVQGVLKETLHS